MGHLRVESCHSIWVFDPATMRFQRLVRGVPLVGGLPRTGWRPYFGLDLDPGSEAFTVRLDRQGTRLLRSWRHVGPVCDACGATPVDPPTPEQLRAAAMPPA